MAIRDITYLHSYKSLLASKRLNSVLAIGLIILIGMMLYMPFASATLYHNDSVGFALAIREFNLRLHQPGGTGYPLYVLALRAVKFLTSTSDNTTIVIVNITATLISALFFYALARRVADTRDALLLSLLFLTSPIIWFNADISKNYPVGMFTSLAVAVTGLKTIQGQKLASYLLPVIWGFAAGFRPELAVIWAPLVLYSARHRLLSSKYYFIVFGLLAALSVGAWLWPLTRLTGGFNAYQEAIRNTASLVSPTSFLTRGDIAGGVELTLQNISVLTIFVLIGCIGVLPLQVIRWFRSSHQINTQEMMKFLLIWLVPGVILHVLTTISISGYTLPYFPAILLILSLPLLTKKLNLNGTVLGASLRIGLLISGIFLQSSFFLLMPQVAGTLSGNWVFDTLLRNAGTEPTHSRIQHYDDTVEYLRHEIQTKYSADKTLLVVPVGDALPGHRTIRPLFDQVTYYLPQWEQRVLYTTPLEVFRQLGFTGQVIAAVNTKKFDLVNTNVVKIPLNVEWLVWFCDETTQPYAFDDSWTIYALHPGVNLVTANVRDVQVRHWGPFEFRQE